jgi:hypothetical protein
MMKEFANNLSNLPSAEEILRMLQGSSHNNHRDIVPSLALFGAGLLVGAGLALLLAPSSGEELRENLSERMEALRERTAGNGEHHEAPNAGPA